MHTYTQIGDRRNRGAGALTAGSVLRDVCAHRAHGHMYIYIHINAHIHTDW